MKQDIAHLIQARQQAPNIKSQPKTQVAKSPIGITLGSGKPKGSTNATQYSNKYDDNKYDDKHDTVLSAIEEN
ncbi:MAG: hypothetical protein ACUVRV_08900 [Cyanobacteriota bacterium]